MVPWRRRAHHSKRAGGRGAGGSCRRHRDPVPPFSDPPLAAPAGSVGISAAVVVATWRAAMLEDPRIDQLAPDRFRRRKRAFCVCAHQPRIAGDISGQERRQPPLDPLSAQCSLPPPLTVGYENAQAYFFPGRNSLFEARVAIPGGLIEEVRFARDSPLEGRVTSERV